MGIPEISINVFRILDDQNFSMASLLSRGWLVKIMKPLPARSWISNLVKLFPEDAEF
jgi:hypothetical protein